jgi:calcineurin-like phosphoesterase family protein
VSCKTWFTADLHFGHKRMLAPLRRFSTLDVMDETIVSRWNERVGQKDDVYVLGDVSFYKPDKTAELLARLNGAQKFLITGNHDKNTALLSRFFAWQKDLHTIKVPDLEATDGMRRIVLCHYAMRIWSRSHYGAWHLYGHSHGSLEDLPTSLSFDVGIDCHDYYPFSYDDVKLKMNLKTYQPVDHHREGVQP